MKIERKFTKAGQDAYAGINFVTTTSEIRNPDGTIVFKLDDVEVPDSWSQVASDVIAQKYFRKAGVPTKTKKVKENDVPEFLWRSTKSSSTTALVGETSSKQVFDRLAGAWTYWGWKGGFFFIVPGAITDIVALIFLIPFTRKYILKLLIGFLIDKMRERGY